MVLIIGVKYRTNCKQLKLLYLSQGWIIIVYLWFYVVEILPASKLSLLTNLYISGTNPVRTSHIECVLYQTIVLI